MTNPTEQTTKPDVAAIARADFARDPEDDPDFMEAWAAMERRGYQWSANNIGKAHLGWLMAKAALRTHLEAQQNDR